MTGDRKKRIFDELAKARKRLVHAGVWNKALTHWVQEEISNEVNLSELEREKGLTEIEEYAKKWTNEKLRDNYFDNIDELKTQLIIPYVLRIWCKKQWMNRIDSLYLEHKNYFDRARCRMIRVKDKAWAYEIYLRIKEGEMEFEKAAREYGEGDERKNSGEFRYQQISSLPYGLGELVKRLEIGNITKPLRMNEWFCIVELMEYTKSVLDDKTREELLAGQLRVWIEAVVKQMENEIEWGE